MNVKYYVNENEHGFFNGREYHGIVRAVCGKKKAEARSYLPDVFDEELGKAIAKKRLRVKVLRSEEVKLNEESKAIDILIDELLSRQSKVICKITSSVLQQERLKDELLDMFEGMKE